MKLIDISAPLHAQLPTCPHNTPWALEPVIRARGDGSQVSALHVRAHAGTPAHPVRLAAGATVIDGLDLGDVESGVYEKSRLPLRIVGSDGASARGVPHRS